MKKNIFNVTFFLVICIGFSSVFGQTSISAISIPYFSINNQIIKEYNYPSTITCDFVTDSFSSFFSYQDATMICTERPVPNCHVLDFVIDNDTVFFCGEGRNGLGIIGFFDINDFFFNMGYAYVQDSFCLGIGDYWIVNASKLVAMVTYTDEFNIRNVVCVGEATEESRSLIYGCIVDMYTTNGVFSNYVSGYLHKGNPDRLLDITHVDKYLVTVGFFDNKYLTLKLFDDNLLFVTMGLCDVDYIYNNFPVSVERVWHPDYAILDSVSPSRFASASVWRHETEQGQGKKIDRLHLATYDLPQMLGLYNTSMQLSSEVQSSQYDLVPKLNGFVRNNLKNKYGLLFNGFKYTDPYNHSYFIEIDRLLDSIIFDMRLQCVESKLYQSLDLYESGGRYVMYGKNFYDYGRIYQVETSGNASLCIPDAENKIESLEPVRSIIMDHPVNIRAGQADPKLYETYEPVERVVEIECNN